MLYLKKFNESFDPQDYMDYLLSEVEESNILENYTNDNFVFVEYGITLDQMSILNSYLDNNKRFKDVKIIKTWDRYFSIFDVLIVDFDFYCRNQKWLYKNIKWNKHPMATANSELSGKISIDLLNKYEKSEMAIGLPKEFSMVRNFGKENCVEFWPQKQMPEPIQISEDCKTYIQYILFKYLGK